MTNVVGNGGDGDDDNGDDDDNDTLYPTKPIYIPNTNIFCIPPVYDETLMWVWCGRSVVGQLIGLYEWVKTDYYMNHWGRWVFWFGMAPVALEEYVVIVPDPDNETDDENTDAGIVAIIIAVVVGMLLLKVIL